MTSLALSAGTGDWKRFDHKHEEIEELDQRLAQDYRIALMSLGGRAVLGVEAGNIADPSPYLDVVRAKHVHIDNLAEDISLALELDSLSRVIRRFEWESEKSSTEARFQSPHMYPLTWFSIRLIELSKQSMQTLDLKGSARQVMNWFTRNSSRLEAYVQNPVAQSVEQGYEFAIAALGGALRRDEVASDYEVIESELSEDRVAAFVSDVYAVAFATDSIERLFERSGAFLELASDAGGAPSERVMRSLEPKGSLAVMSEDTQTYYPPLYGDDWGAGLTNDTTKLFCEALSQAPETIASLDTPEALLKAIDNTAKDLNSSRELIVVLAGDWRATIVDLNESWSDEFEQEWRMSEADRVGALGNYRGHRIVEGSPDGDRRLYIAEPRTWGCLVSGHIKPHQELLVEIKCVSAVRARELLDENPCHFSSEPDEVSKLRKLQTYVEIVVRVRREFRVHDPSRARRIVSGSR